MPDYTHFRSSLERKVRIGKEVTNDNFPQTLDAKHVVGIEGPCSTYVLALVILSNEAGR